MGRCPAKAFLTLATVLWLAGCKDSTGIESDASDDWGMSDDTDGDHILDVDEGRASMTDTDSDTIPDYRDDDSDGDTILDVVEAGDSDHLSPPVDSDGDTTPDFRDLDSDDNGIDDEHEGAGDTDRDGIPDHADVDNDGDSMDDVDELGAGFPPPLDSDGDGMPDYMDLDSDDDTIGDLHEAPHDSDVDGDTIPDRLDPDSDGDTIPDSEEAGDHNVSTPPEDTDGDGIADFRDLDSDGDGLSDDWERGHGLDPYDVDSDDDGVSDFVEIGADTDPLDAADRPVVFLVPYNDPGDPPDVPLDPEPLLEHLALSGSIQKADVFLAMNSNSSMVFQIRHMRANVAMVMIPGIQALLPDTWFGVGMFENCGACYYSMAIEQEITNDPVLVEDAFGVTYDCDGFSPNAHFLYALATGDLSPFSAWDGVNPASWTCTSPGAIGWPCFRSGALPIIVQVGDTGFSECTPRYTWSDAADALNLISAKYIGLDPAGSFAMNQVASATGSVDSAGEPLTFIVPGDGTGLSTQIVDAFEVLVDEMPLDLSAEVVDDPVDSVDVVAEFVESVQPNAPGGHIDPALSRECVGGSVGDLLEPLDGTPDSFVKIAPGTHVCFDLMVRQNWTVPATDEPQLFAGSIRALAGGVTLLESRAVYFVVPAGD
jgi:hypothetical protein